MRAFVALPLPPPVLAALGKFQETLQTRLHSTAVRWTRLDQLHLTLKFLGLVPADQMGACGTALREACRSVASFRLDAGQAGCFPDSDRPRVIWAGVGGELERLRQLRDRLDRVTAGFGDHAEDREFTPHLTLGRVRASGLREARRVGELVEATNAGRFGEWEVGVVNLMRSELSPAGALYQCLAAVPLGVESGQTGGF